LWAKGIPVARRFLSKSILILRLSGGWAITRAFDVAIVGAGPYGLSVAAHLSHSGVDFRIFGKPMATWRFHMPKGMMLKSDRFASCLSAPAGGHTLKDYCLRNGIAYDEAAPLPLDEFNDYALDFQRRFVPGLDQRAVAAIVEAGAGFDLALEDGEHVTAKRVVMAVGVTHFTHMPEILGGLGPLYVSHSSAHHTFERFRGSDVAVIGAGASAIDLGASLHECGARVTLVTRAERIRFTSKPGTGGGRSSWRKIRHPPSGLGPGLRSRLCCDWPHLFRFLPAALRLSIVRRHLGPSSPWYMRDRVIGKVDLVQGFGIEKAAIEGRRVVLSLNRDGRADRRVEADHVIAATGFRADLDRLAVLDETLRRRIRGARTMPALSTGFESSVPGLYFTGLAAAGSFGPLMRFMYGADFAARTISRRLAR
jgi:ribulose 1,5-bisphosphate synthetase/thiazole synthase